MCAQYWSIAPGLQRFPTYECGGSKDLLPPLCVTTRKNRACHANRVMCVTLVRARPRAKLRYKHYGRALPKSGGEKQWNASAICETHKTNWQTENHHMKRDLELHFVV